MLIKHKQETQRVRIPSLLYSTTILKKTNK